MSAILAADGCVVSDMDEQRARLTEYFEELWMAGPPRGQLLTTGLRIANADGPISETATSLARIKEGVVKSRDGNALGVCNFSAELLKAGGPS